MPARGSLPSAEAAPAPRGSPEVGRMDLSSEIARNLAEVDRARRALLDADRSSDGNAGGRPGANPGGNQLPPNVLGEPGARCLWVGSSTVNDSTRYELYIAISFHNECHFRHLLQLILQYRPGVDEARPVGRDMNNIQGI